MKKRLFIVSILLGALFILSGISSAHCEIPCGIYDDEMRVKMIYEHISTIEKSMKQILILEKDADRNYNQLIRWVVNKEEHANELQEIVTQYFMTQRIKPEANDYAKKISTLHLMLIYSMKCKQTTDLANIEKLRNLVREFEALYFK